LFTTVDQINQVNREEIRRVAQKYFNGHNRTVAILIPETSAATPKE
jgi:predicted Zn-dependent peptidase